MIIESHTGFDALGGLYDEWMRMAETAPGGSIFLTPLWLGLWWKHFGDDRDLHILTARKPSGDLVGAGAFYIDDGSLELVGSEDLCDYRDILALPGFEEEVVGGFLSSLDEVRSWKGIVLRSVPSGSRTVQAIERIAGERSRQVTIEKEDDCPVLELPPSWTDFLEHLGRRDRHEIRRKMRNFFEGRESDAVLIQDREGLAVGMEKFFRLHALSSREKADFMGEGRRKFFSDMAVALMEHGMLKLTFLRAEGREIAGLLCFDFDSTRYAYNSGYDPGFSALSPGIVLFAESIRDAIEEGRKQYDFLKGTESYKLKLGATARPIHRIELERKR